MSACDKCPKCGSRDITLVADDMGDYFDCQDCGFAFDDEGNQV